MSTSRPQPIPGRLEPPPSIRWRVWPLRDEPLGTAATMVGFVAAAALVQWVTGRTRLAVLAVGVLALALWQFFVPAGYEMDVRGIERHLFGRRRRIPWNAVRRYVVGRGGVTIVRHGDGRPTDALLATHLPWGDRREEVLAQIRYYVGPPSE